MNNKKILLEEITRIHEIMGIPKKRLILENRWDSLVSFTDEIIPSFVKTYDEVTGALKKVIVPGRGTALDESEFNELQRIMKSSNADDWVNGPPKIMDEIYYLIKSSYNPNKPGVVDTIYEDLIGELCRRSDVSEAELLDALNTLAKRNNTSLTGQLALMGIDNPFFTKTLGAKLSDRLVNSKKLGTTFDDLNPKGTRLKPQIQNAINKVIVEPPPGLSLFHKCVFTWLTLPKWALLAGSIQKYYAKWVADASANLKTLEQQIEAVTGDIIEANRIVTQDIGTISSDEVVVRLTRAAYGSQSILAKSKAEDVESLYLEIEKLLKESLPADQAAKIPEIMQELRKVDPFDTINYKGNYVDNFLSGTATAKTIDNFLGMLSIFRGNATKAKESLKEFMQRALYFTLIGTPKSAFEINSFIRTGQLFGSPWYKSKVLQLFGQMWVSTKIGMPITYFAFYLAKDIWGYWIQLGNPDSITWGQFVDDLWGKSVSNKGIIDKDVKFGPTADAIIQSDLVTFLTPIHLNFVGWGIDLGQVLTDIKDDKINAPEFKPGPVIDTLKKKTTEVIDGAKELSEEQIKEANRQKDSAFKAMEEAKTKVEAYKKMIDSTTNQQNAMAQSTAQNFSKKFGSRASKWCGDDLVGVLTDGSYVAFDGDIGDWVTFSLSEEDKKSYCKTNVTNF